MFALTVLTIYFIYFIFHVGFKEARFGNVVSRSSGSSWSFQSLVQSPRCALKSPTHETSTARLCPPGPPDYPGPPIPPGRGFDTHVAFLTPSSILPNVQIIRKLQFLLIVGWISTMHSIPPPRKSNCSPISSVSVSLNEVPVRGLHIRVALLTPCRGNEIASLYRSSFPCL